MKGWMGMNGKTGAFSVRRGAIRAAMNVVLLVAVAVVLVFSVFLVRNKMLQNTQALGMALARSYAAEAELHLATLQQFALLAGEYLDETGEPAEAQAWLKGYFHKLTGIIGENSVDPYAVIDGRIIAANPWQGDEGFDFQQADWYRRALEAGGEAVCSDVYTDAITGKKVFTISLALAAPGDVFAMDVFLENASIRNIAYALPETSSYFLCDQNGTLLYADTALEAGGEELQEYLDFLLAGIEDGSLLPYNASFQDLDGVARGAYFWRMTNGWTVILTIPFHAILQGDANLVVYLMAGIAVLLFAVLAYLSIRDVVQGRAARRANDAAHMLGDSFYGIYRINFREGVYEGIKMNPDIQHELPPKGAYALMLQAMETVVSPSTYQAFARSFSLESIRERVAEGIADYGGDYQRRFGTEYRWVNVRTLYDPVFTPDEVILCFRDVDEEKRRELQHSLLLQDALEAAQSSTKARTEFFSRMSHDMRTPLNAILGCCDLAQRECAAGESEKAQAHMGKIAFAGKQLLSLINDILELSRAEAGKTDLQEEPFDLRQMLQNTAELFRPLAANADKRFEVRLDLRADWVLGDEAKIGQVVNNLLSNAFKYSNPGASVRLEARQLEGSRPGGYEIVVEDTGIGMSAEFLEHLFEPYTRETAFSAHPSVGTGLGMPIVKNLVQQMAGTISVESELGKGSRFAVTLPLQAAQEPGAEAAAEPAQPFDWAGRNILVAEDNELNMEILTEILRQLGAQVLQAHNGREAVEVFAQSAPYSVDAILMDMQMPEMDGCQAASAIRALERADAPWVPIVAVTANAFKEDIDRTTRAGMDGHVSKPIQVEQLSLTLQKIVQERASRVDGAREKEEGHAGR